MMMITCMPAERIEERYTVREGECVWRYICNGATPRNSEKEFGKIGPWAAYRYLQLQRLYISWGADEINYGAVTIITRSFAPACRIPVLIGNKIAGQISDWLDKGWYKGCLRHLIELQGTRTPLNSYSTLLKIFCTLKFPCDVGHCPPSTIPNSDIGPTRPLLRPHEL